jgi:diguanylate cyclase (GGDEF)-like protein
MPDKTTKLSVPDFAKRIKSKFPGSYDTLDDAELTERVLRKHPTYANQIDLPQGFSLLRATSGHPKLDAVYEAAGREHNVDPNLILLQGKQETINFNPDVLYGRLNSPKAARGAGQFMAGTAPSYGLKVGNGIDERTDPIKSINAQAKYMRKLLDQFDGDEDLALAGYNAGEGAVEKYSRKVPPYKETQGYVKTIRGNLEKARQRFILKQLLGDQKPVAGQASSPTFPGQAPPITQTLGGTTAVEPPPPAPETPETIQTQLLSALDGKTPRVAVLTTEPKQNALIQDGAFRNSVTPVPVKEGILWISTAKARKLGLKTPEQITQYVDKVGVAPLIGKVDDVGQNTATGDALVSTDARGKELSSSIVTSPESAAKQAEVDREQFPQTVNQQIVSAQEAVKLRQGVASPRQQSVKQQPEQIAAADGIYQPNTAFKEVVGFNDKPDDVSNMEWTVQQLVPKLAARLGYDTIDIEKALRLGFKKTYGTPLAKIQKGGTFTFEMTPEFAETIENIAVGKREALQKLVASGRDIDDATKERLSKELGLDAAEINSAISGQYEYADVFKQGQANKQRHADALARETAILKPDEPSTVAQIRAAAEVGWIDQSELNKQVAEEKDIYRRLLEENKSGAALDLSGIGQARLGIEGSMPKTFDPNAPQYSGKDAIDVLIKQYGSLSNYKQTQDDLREKYKYRPLAAPLEFAKRFGNAVPKAAASLLETTAIAGDIVKYPMDKALEYAGLQTTSAENTPLYQLGKSIDAYFTGLQNKDFDNIVLVTAGDTLGQVAVQMIAGFASGGATLPTLIGASMGASQQYEEASKFTKSKEMKLFAALAGGAASIPDAIVFNKWFKTLGKGEKTDFINSFAKSIYSRLGVQFGDETAEVLTKKTLSAWVGNMAKGGAFQGVQEVSENKINDIVALLSYDRSETRKQKLLSINDEDIASFFGGLIGGVGGGAVQTALEQSSIEEQKDFVTKAQIKLSNLVDGGTFTPDEAVVISEKLDAYAKPKESKPLVKEQKTEKTPDVQESILVVKTTLEKDKLVEDEPVQVSKVNQEVAKGTLEAENKPVAEKEHWEMTRDEWLANVNPILYAEPPNHYKEVSDAVSQGKPVPAAVLADYPELAKQKPTSPIREQMKASAKSLFPAKAAEEAVQESKGGVKDAAIVGQARFESDRVGRRRAEQQVEVERRTAREERRKTAFAEKEARTDPLTGLANRRSLDEALPAAEADPNTSIISFDANNFGQVNKELGEDAGDAALKDVGDALNQAAKENGIPGRVFRRGGDEFVILAPRNVADKVRESAEKLYGDRQYGKTTVSLTGTVGNTFAKANEKLQSAKAERKARAFSKPDFSLNLVTNSADIKKLNVLSGKMGKFKSPSGLETTDEVTYKDLYDDIVERQSVLQQLADCVNG